LGEDSEKKLHLQGSSVLEKSGVVSESLIQTFAV
jgi:hypothetical protein